jgi:hypothetical protein
MKKALIRPFVLFACEPIIQLLGVYMAIIYGLLYRKPMYTCSYREYKLTLRPVFITTLPDIFSNIYEERIGVAGLNYLALGVGLTGASQINARLLDVIYRKLKEKNGGKGRPEYRLRASGAPFLPFLTRTLSVYVPWHNHTSDWTLPHGLDGKARHPLDRTRYRISFRH